MEPVLFILAAAGISAVLLRIARALFRLIQRSGEAWILSAAAKSRERSGDLTALGEVADLESRARAARRNAILRVGLWVVLLLIPPFTPWTLPLYASYSVLWLVRSRVRSGTLTTTDPGPRP